MAQELIMKSCAKDGRLLQGDKPAMTLNSEHVANAFGGASVNAAASGPQRTCSTTATLPDGNVDTDAIKKELSTRRGKVGGQLWATHTTLSGFTFAVVLAANRAASSTVSLKADLGLTSHKYLSYEANTTDVLTQAPSISIAACGKWDFQVCGPLSLSGSLSISLSLYFSLHPLCAAVATKMLQATNPVESE
jgi:hypothetical protein